MGINRQSNISASLQIGPTDLGMVRIYLEGEGIALPLDFEPDEAVEIADELLAAVETARAIQQQGAEGPKAGGQGGKGRKRQR